VFHEHEDIKEICTSVRVYGEKLIEINSKMLLLDEYVDNHFCGFVKGFKFK